MFQGDPLVRGLFAIWASLLTRVIPVTTFGISFHLHHHLTEASEVMLIVSDQLLSVFSQFFENLPQLVSASHPPSSGRVISKHASYPLLSHKCSYIPLPVFLIIWRDIGRIIYNQHFEEAPTPNGLSPCSLSCCSMFCLLEGAWWATYWSFQMHLYPICGTFELTCLFHEFLMVLFEFGIHLQVLCLTRKVQTVPFPGPCSTFHSLCQAPFIQTVFLIVKVMLEAREYSNAKFFESAFHP